MIYLNNAATSYPKPQNVISAVNRYLENPPVSFNRGGSSNYDPSLELRKKISNFINCDNINKIAFSSGATESLNLIINGLNLSDCKVVITNTEHNSVIRPLNHLRKDGKIKIEVVKCLENGLFDLNDFDNAIDENTRLVVLNHCSNVTGLEIDIESVSKIAKSKNALLLVDCSQSIGAVPIDVKKWNADFIAFTAHKSLFGISGFGVSFIDSPELIKPLKMGGTGFFAEFPYQVEETPAKFEAGTPNGAGIIALNAGFDFIENEGFQNILKKKKELTRQAIDGLSSIKGVKILGDTNGDNRSSTVSFLIEGWEPDECAMILNDSYDIKIRAGLHCAPLIFDSLKAPKGSVRASFSYFNTPEEINSLIFAVKEITESLK